MHLNEPFIFALLHLSLNTGWSGAAHLIRHNQVGLCLLHRLRGEMVDAHSVNSWKGYLLKEGAGEDFTKHASKHHSAFK